MGRWFFNRRVRFGTDRAVWGKQGYQTPALEVLGRAKGYCEDFVIATSVTLKLPGIPSERLKMTYVKARIDGPQTTHDQTHRVLGHYPAPGDEPLVLDNPNPGIGPASRRSCLTMVFGFNTGGLGVDGANLRAASTSQWVSKWQSANARLREEGIS